MIDGMTHQRIFQRKINNNSFLKKLSEERSHKKIRNKKIK